MHRSGDVRQQTEYHTSCAALLNKPQLQLQYKKNYLAKHDDNGNENATKQKV